LKIYHDLKQFKSTKKTIVTLGTFDGVHLGHRKIIDRLVNESKTNGFESVVLTFFPHPRMVIQEDKQIKLLNTMEEKATLLEDLGLDHLIVHPFDKKFSRLTALEFIEEILISQLNVAKIITGHDHRFGRNRTANIDDLIRYGSEFGFEVAQISAQEIEEVSVSSTKIRKALFDGNIKLANNYLTKPYFITGKVTHGKGIGRTIGYPTANIHIDQTYKLVPKNGVYVVSSLFEGQTIRGMMNIGINPTVEGIDQSLEVFFFDFEQNLYHQYLPVFFHEYVREEKKFENLDALKLQLAQDEIFCKNFFNSRA
jgi:riboflavin kinase/FMN adenylyltransferase